MDNVNNEYQHDVSSSGRRVSTKHTPLRSNTNVNSQGSRHGCMNLQLSRWLKSGHDWRQECFHDSIQQHTKLKGDGQDQRQASSKPASFDQSNSYYFVLCHTIVNTHETTDECHRIRQSKSMCRNTLPCTVSYICIVHLGIVEWSWWLLIVPH